MTPSFRDFFVSGPFISPVSGFFVMSYPRQLTCALLSISRHFNRGQIEDICSRHAVSFCLQEVGSPLVCQCFLSNQNAEGSKVLWESRLLGTKKLRIWLCMNTFYRNVTLEPNRRIRFYETNEAQSVHLRTRQLVC